MPPRKQTRPTPALRPRRSTTGLDPALMWSNLTKMFVVLSLLLTPLVISTSLTDTWEQPKTLVLAALMSLAWICYFITIFRRRTVDWNWHLLDWMVIFLVGATIISTMLSVNNVASIWGLGSWSSSSLPAVLSFASLYFLLGQTFRSRHDQTIGWTSLLTGTGAAILVMMFQLSQVSLLPKPLQASPLLGTISSSPSHVAVIAALFGAVALLLWTRTTERWARWGIVACVTMSWLVLFFFQQPVGWAVFALGMIAVIVDQSLAGRQANVNVLITAVAIAALGMLMQLTGVAHHAHLPSTADILLDQTTTAKISVSTIMHRSVLGSGPSTWYQDFVKYRPASFNQSPYWSLRFITGASEWWQQLATGGIVIFGLWVGILTMAGWWIWRHIRKQPRALLAGTVLTIVAVFLSGFFSTWSWVLLLWLWAGLGLSRSQLVDEKPATPMGASAPVWFTIVALVLVGYWWNVSQVTTSDFAYQQARTKYNAIAPIDQVITLLQRSVKLNPRNTNALTLLGNAEITKAQLAVQQNPSVDLTTLLQPPVSHLKQAIAADPNNPALYEEMNNLLNRLSGAIGDVATEANGNFRTLEKLEPTNPIHDVGDGQTLMVIRTGLQSTQNSSNDDTQRLTILTMALEAYQRALNKKPDYAQARFALAQAQAEGGKNQDAIKNLDELASTFNQVGQYWGERAVVLTHLKETELADKAFAQATALAKTDPSIYLAYANALVTAGTKDKAISILKQGLAAVPGTAALQSRVDELSK